MKCSTNRGSTLRKCLFLLQQKLEETPKRLRFTKNNPLTHKGGHGRTQETDQVGKGREVKGGRGRGGGGGRASAGVPDVAAVAWLSAALKMTAFTLQLKNSSSDHLFSHPGVCVVAAGWHSSCLCSSSQLDVGYSLSHSLRNLLSPLRASASQFIQSSQRSQSNSTLPKHTHTHTASSFLH